MQALLGKIEEELKQAKQSNSESLIREKIYAVKTLCELVLAQERATTSVIIDCITTPGAASGYHPISTATKNESRRGFKWRLAL